MATGCRIYLENYLFKPLFTVSRFQELLSVPLLENAEAIAILAVIIFVSLWITLIWKIRKRFMIEYCPFLEAFIRKVEIEEEELQRVFPDFFTKAESRRNGNA